MRRRALLAANQPRWEEEDLPPESTTFEFPLYLNTKVIEKTPDFLYRSREGDEISNQLYGFYIINATGNNYDVPNSVLQANPVYIDGALVKYARNAFGAIQLRNDKDYGDYEEISVFLEDVELYVEGYN